MPPPFAHRTQIIDRETDILCSEEIGRRPEGQFIQSLIEEIQRTPPTQNTLRSAHPLQSLGQGAIQPHGFGLQLESHIHGLISDIDIAQAHPLGRDDQRVFDGSGGRGRKSPHGRVIHRLDPQKKPVDRASIHTTTGHTPVVDGLHLDPGVSRGIRGHRELKPSIGRIDAGRDPEKRRIVGDDLQQDQLAGVLIGGPHPDVLQKSRKRRRAGRRVLIDRHHHARQGPETRRIVDAHHFDRQIPDNGLRTTRAGGSQIIGSNLDDLGAEKIGRRTECDQRKGLIHEFKRPPKPLKVGAR